MWDHKYLPRIDLKLIFIVLALMAVSIIVISSMTADLGSEQFMTSYVRSQLQWFVIGWLVFLFCAGFDYRKLREWSWIFYGLMVIMLFGLYFTAPIQSVHRWYKIPFIGIYIQPSEYSKLIVVICLSWFLEKKQNSNTQFSTAIQAVFIVAVPFLLILKQPDLGTALVLYPIALVIFYFADMHKAVFRSMLVMGFMGGIFITLMFSGVISHEEIKPVCTKFLKEYQFNRLDPNTYHQNASKIAIAVGGVSGSGWRKSDFSSKKWLPAAHTDSVFSAYAEEFGLIGVIVLLLLFYCLIHISFNVVAASKDYFGSLLASGIAVYLAMHIIVNIGMMCGFLPISGVPLLLITYGGSSIVTTMGALGILQSIYTRRFMF